MDTPTVESWLQEVELMQIDSVSDALEHIRSRMAGDISPVEVICSNTMLSPDEIARVAVEMLGNYVFVTPSRTHAKDSQA